MRNAKYDKAKRQAVGIYRAASPQASINAGVTQYAGGDYRTPEAAKACYRNENTQVADQAAIAAFLSNGGKVTRCRGFYQSNGRIVQPGSCGLNRKRGNADS